MKATSCSSSITAAKILAEHVGLKSSSSLVRRGGVGSNSTRSVAHLLRPSGIRSFHAVAATATTLSSSSDRLSRSKAAVLNINTNTRSNNNQMSQRFFSSGGKRDFYEVLGVPKSADKATIKKAYFKLAKQHHPDTNQGNDKAADKFKEATEAYEVLSDDKQREMYNQFGHAGVDPNFQGADGNPFGEGFEGFNFQDGSFHFQGGGPGEMDAEEIFDMFFGSQGGGSRRRRSRGPRRGQDLQMHVRVSFMEAVFGTEKDLDLRYQQVNSKTGSVSVKERKVNVKIPAGIDNGMNLRLQGQGAEGDPGAQSGNLLVQVIVDSDPNFERDGYDVHTEVPINIIQAVLGGTVDVKTLKGEVEMKIPKGCQPDAKLLLRGKGIQELNGHRKGNHYVHVKLEIPKEISKRQEELLREFEEEGKPKSKGFAKAASSAFEKLFGKDKKKKKGQEEDSSGSSDKEETTEEKKTA
eukprot:CAMPEP_0172456170 /NCGR_PEP_ID=MMETSP1065-20121228/14242_1 /TAXON_ID=265537 /ORGANISM="Amphiprora paludosa, Strain CCMP125" /LENGTH=465 /DNA_ID=CAMNT_0013208875 /DNA_START=64 /DNA_END=1461 /DNA_ORIENTATION=+